MKKILVIGSINMDMVLKTDRIPLPGESFFGSEYRYSPGGKGANQAVAGALLGADVSFAGKLGQDSHAETLNNVLRQRGVSTAFLSRSEREQSGLAVILLEKNGDNRIIVYNGANGELSPADIQQALSESYDAVILQFEIPDVTVIEACRLAKSKGIPVIVDAGPAKDFPLEKISGITILSPNETETYMMCGIELESETNVLKAAKILKRRSNAEHIVIKMGSKGAYLYSGDRLELIPVMREVTPVDTTAAGDCFTAALTVSYLQDLNIKEAISYAHVAAGISVTRPGAIASMPTFKEVDAQISLMDG